MAVRVVRKGLATARLAIAPGDERFKGNEGVKIDRTFGITGLDRNITQEALQALFKNQANDWKVVILRVTQDKFDRTRNYWTVGADEDPKVRWFSANAKKVTINRIGEDDAKVVEDKKQPPPPGHVQAKIDMIEKKDADPKTDPNNPA